MHDDELYYAAQSNSGGDSSSPAILIYTYSFSSPKTDSIKLLLPHASLWRLGGLAVNDKFIAIKCDSIYIFDRNTKKLFNSFNNYHSEGIKFLNSNRLFLYKNYDFHPLDDSIKTNLTIYDVEKNHPLLSIRPRFNYLGYTHLVSNFISAKDDKIAFAQTMPYDVKIFSAKDLTQISEITAPLNNSAEQIE
ncbi:MAG TPA: hypothetical protein VHA52_10540, partial [Candidatus Babeliaceae bacterium]|nr:hypothetical protein [Candidatus Babeliaceae bacterium]